MSELVHMWSGARADFCLGSCQAVRVVRRARRVVVVGGFIVVVVVVVGGKGTGLEGRGEGVGGIMSVREK